MKIRVNVHTATQNCFANYIADMLRGYDRESFSGKEVSLEKADTRINCIQSQVAC